MRHARRELTERRQLFAHNYLVLSQPQIPQHRLQLIVLALQLLRQLFHKVQPLHFQGMQPEYLQGGRHIRDLVAPAYLDLRLQIAARHTAHPIRQHLKASQQHPAHEQPRD